MEKSRKTNKEIRRYFLIRKFPNKKIGNYELEVSITYI